MNHKEKKTYGNMSIVKSQYHSEHLRFKLKTVNSYMPPLCKDSNLWHIHRVALYSLFPDSFHGAKKLGNLEKNPLSKAQEETQAR